jgi:hypothetical protein
MTEKRKLSRKQESQLIKRLKPDEAVDWKKDNVVSCHNDVIKPSTLLPTSTDSRNPIIFNIGAHEGQHIDTKNIELKATIKVQVKNDDGEWVNTENKHKVCLYPNTLYSIFEEQLVYVGNILVESTMRQHQLISYLKTLLYESETKKQGELSAAYYFPDEPIANMGVVEKKYDKNPGEYWRSDISDGREIELRGKVLSDIFNCNVPFPDNASIQIKLIPAEHCLFENVIAARETDATTGEERVKIQTPNTYRVNILDAELIVPRIQLKRKIPRLLPHRFFKHKLLSFLHNKAEKEFGFKSLALNHIPNKCLVGIISEESFEGNINNHRFYLRRGKDVENVLLRVNGKHLPTQFGYTIDARKGKVADAYLGLFNEFNAQTSLTIKEFAWTPIFAFDCTTDKSGSKMQQSLIRGTTDLNIKFRELKHNVYVLVLVIESGKFFIDKDGACILDSTTDIE